MKKSNVTKIRPQDIDAEEFIHELFVVNEDVDDCPVLSEPAVSSSGDHYFINHHADESSYKKIPTSDTPFYYCVSGVLNRPSLRRRRQDCTAAYVLGLDDIGTKGKPPPIEPTYKMETSEGNFQYGYCLEPFALDGQGNPRTLYYEACVDGLIAAGWGDEGAGGCYRLLRVPASINTKEQNNGWRSRVTYWQPDRMWKLETLMKELGVEPVYKAKDLKRKGSTEGFDVINDVAFDWLEENGRTFNRSGEWIDVTCPWSDAHTDGATIAGYSPKGLGNDGRQFNCFHEHCKDRTTDDFLARIAEDGAPDVGAMHDMSLGLAIITVEAAIAEGDAGALYATNTLLALDIIKVEDKPTYYNLRPRLKAVTPITDLEAEIKASRHIDTSDELTHRRIAEALLNSITDEDDCAPVSTLGSLYRCKDGLWSPSGREALVSAVSTSRFDGDAICRRGGDYRSIADLMMLSVEQPTFFDNAPKGVAAEGKFYSVTDKGVLAVPLTAEHRCHFQLSAKPEATTPTPIFTQFLAEVFRSDLEGHSEGQHAVLQEAFGAVLIGQLAATHKALVLYGEARAGKGVITNILRAFLPASTVSAVSPFDWDKEYFTANMAGKQLNIVGEFPQEKPLPAAPFKLVVGGDLITGRHPHGRPFSFVCDAAQWANCNSMPYCREQSDAIYLRFQTVYFAHTTPETKRRKDLAKDIIADELGGILHWALEGAVRLQKTERFTPSPAHEQVMSDWRNRVDSVARYLSSEGINYLESVGGECKRSDLFAFYNHWCKNVDLANPVNRNSFSERLKSCRGVAIRRKPDNVYVFLAK
mgnify:CR=1 FL=1